MKKKFKLLTSIASLGLAIALMAFGVLAAANVTVNIKSNVSYSVGTNVIMKLTGASAAQKDSTPIASLDETGVSTNGTEEEGTTLEYTIGDVELKVGEVAVYTFKLENLNKNDALAVTINASATGYTVTGDTGEQADIAAGASANYTIVFEPTDKTADMDAAAITLNFELEAK